MLEEMGYAIEEAHPRALDDDTMFKNVAVIIRTNVAATLDVWGERIGRPIVQTDIEPLNWEYYKLGKEISSVQYLRALQAMHAWSRDVESWWEEYDLLVTPTICELPPPLGAYRPTDAPWDPFYKNKIDRSGRSNPVPAGLCNWTSRRTTGPPDSVFCQRCRTGPNRCCRPR